MFASYIIKYIINFIFLQCSETENEIQPPPPPVIIKSFAKSLDNQHNNNHNLCMQGYDKHKIVSTYNVPKPRYRATLNINSGGSRGEATGSMCPPFCPGVKKIKKT